MTGDRTGSPNGAPGQSTPFPLGHPGEQDTYGDAPRTPDFGTPSTDVKVAGPAPASASAYAQSSDAWAGDDVVEVDGFRPADRRSAARPNRFTLPRIAVVAAAAAVVMGGGAAAYAITGSGDGKTEAASVAPSDAPAAVADPTKEAAAQQAAAAAERRSLLDRASRAARKDSGKRPMLATKGSPLPTATPTPSAAGGSGGGGGAVGDPVPAGQAQQIAKGLLPSYGFSGSGQFGCLVNLWTRESGWNTHAANPSGAYGIPQAKPGSKMAGSGPDWRNNATTQIKWGLKYIKDRYNTPCGAWKNFQNIGWY